MMSTAAQRMHGASMRPKRTCIIIRCAATAAERHKRAAAKYRTGPTAMTLYTRPNLAQDLEEFNLAEQVSKFTAAAASNPQLYALKLADERSKVEEENRRVSWSDIL